MTADAFSISFSPLSQPGLSCSTGRLGQLPVFTSLGDAIRSQALPALAGGKSTLSVKGGDFPLSQVKDSFRRAASVPALLNAQGFDDHFHGFSAVEEGDSSAPLVCAKW